MPDATITSTASTFGTISGVFSADQSTISGTISGIVPGTLTGSVGVPGPAGPAGIGLPAGGTSGQFLQKTSGVDYATDWVTLNLSAYATESWVTAGFYPLTGNPSGFLTASALTPYLLSSTASATYQTLAGMSSYLTTSAAAAGYYPLSGNPSGFLTAASLSGYATESWVTGQGYITSAALSPYLTSATASTTYQTLSGMSDYLAKAGNLAGLANTGTARTNLGLGSLAVVNDAPSDGSQYARKNAAWDVVISGDRYLTTSTTSNTVSNGNKTFTIGTGLSYTPTQNITISYDASNHMHGEVLTYNSGTGVLTVDINHHTGSGTYSAWVVNVGGVTPATSVAWGAITGTLSSQTDLQNALDLKLAATTAASTYQTLSGMSSYLTSSTAASTYATILEPSVDGILTVEPSGLQTATVNVNQDANNYIHLRAGAGQIAMVVGGSTRWFFNDTYLQFPGGTQQTVAYPGPSGFLLKADNLSGLANTGTARTNLGLGTMATATAADYSTTTVANGLYYPLSSNPAGYLTSAPVTSVAGRTGAITLAVADVSGAAPLASPTFSGTPSLPTGTLGVTQTAGNNTTALATTAFVQQEVPAASTTAAGKVELATVAESHASTSTSLVPTPFGIQFAVAQGMSQRMDFLNTTAVSGSAAVTSLSGFREVYTNAVSSAGRAAFFLGGQSGTTYTVFGSNGNEIKLDFSKKIWMAGRFSTGINSTYVGDANGTALITLGGYTGFATGNMTAQGIGLQKVGGTASVIQLIVHNGTTFTSVNTSKTLAIREQTDYMIHSDGAGNVSLYIEGALAASTSAGPTGITADFGGIYREQVEQTASAAVRYSMHCYGGYLCLE
jgi:hypothetical protein